MEYTSGTKEERLRLYKAKELISYSKAEREKLEIMIEEYIQSGYIPETSAMRQILAFTNCFTDEENPYLEYINYLKTHYDIYGDVLVVGAGQNPVEAEYLSNMQIKVNKGTVTVMEPCLRVRKSKKVKYITDFFSEYTDLSKVSLVTGYKVREVALPVVRGSNAQRKPFCIGVSYDLPSYYQEDLYSDMTVDRWHEEICEEAKSTIQDGEIIIEPVNKPNNKYLIIRSEQKKKRLN